MDIVKILLQGLLVLSSLFLVLLILMHKGSGGGLSDMFGGGSGANLGGSSRAERNLNRITVGAATIWILAIIGLGLVERFN
ncbi:preprotein translocase subunit SecG [Dermacoccus nishinomiyaensis]|uniref:Protein-export membrane protein SecG n=1 Tax=Dermacoccus nishinomiyaensis TaxID=1274 RepID=A0A075JF37_9MICO|nr:MULTISPECIES: preprotein translocase subunit SecG [Dermacoccus]MBO1757267.1 preprotein translocase subunit SecG [Dermacoccus sp. NHGro5]HCQ18439.1 preprotein translocase subunit SecG [Dermacoccus sp.]AIF40856.1 preprotein translocase subunit SecG [Dermacoccus nishinomiyaensis]EFP58122.1 preprotein translocase, SecG subunit [Dermacoccus sp. Ellin185]MCG7428412.1 preprotein translocase subunit SecG [Dermacoccus nishinomiyaensis]